MKTLIIYITVMCSIFLACTEEDNLFFTYNELDTISLDGMGEAFEHASLYNDSLIMCVDGNLNCDMIMLSRLDEMFHFYENEFEFHHSNYSHNNVSDDHHHENGQRVRHGWMMTDQHDDESDGHNNSGGGPEPHDDEEEHSYNHDLHSWDEMMDLIEHHNEVHPG